MTMMKTTDNGDGSLSPVAWSYGNADFVRVGFLIILLFGFATPLSGGGRGGRGTSATTLAFDTCSHQVDTPIVCVGNGQTVSVD
jgi:hypothetical protein